LRYQHPRKQRLFYLFRPKMAGMDGSTKGSWIKALARKGRMFLRAKRGSVAIITALAAIPMCFLAGMGIDYGTAVDRQSQLNAIADAAALAAVTPTMMSQSTANAQTAAQNTFDAQAAAVSNINWKNGNLTVTIVNSGAKRTVTVSYATTYNTYFPSLLGQGTIALSGSSSATGGMAPNINFYLLLDDSPSMAIAATTSGISTMIANTQGQCDKSPYGGTTCGCAFGCHEQAPNSQYESHYVRGNSSAQTGLGNSGGLDNYALARQLGVTLRIDLLNQAVQNLMTTAQAKETSNNAQYEMALYTFDYQFNKPALQALTTSLSTAQASAANLSLLEVYANNHLTEPPPTGPAKTGAGEGDQDTDLQAALSGINTIMADPGSGTNNKGDTPQEILFLVTDGVNDSYNTNQKALSSAYGSYTGNRQQSTINPLNGSTEPYTDWCTTIKNRGIRIAVLYTQYLPITNNGWYNTYIAPIQPTPADNVGTQLQACASPGLYQPVTTDGDVSAALATLFLNAVSSAYLSQ
jgi:Flp pilus assembly protein TadG